MPPGARVYKTPAIVLRHRKLGETDQILVLYTAHLGKLEAVAKGVRKAKSRMGGHVEPLTQATFLLARGKSLDIVTQVETIESFAALRGDLDRMSRALYVCELLDRFVEQHAENFELYRLLLDTLRCLETRDELDLPVRFFEMTLLDALGYKPELDECVRCRRRLRPDTNYWSAGAGGTVCPDCRQEEAALRPISANAVKLLRLLAHGRFADVARVAVDAELHAELERALGEYVRWVLERDVRSAAFVDAVRRRPARRSAPIAEDATTPL